MAATDTEGLEGLLAFLKSNRGFDFTGYKRASLERRVAKRMEELDVPGFAEYVEHLELNPEEFALLFNTILINVTGFFRDASAWEYLSSEIVPRILEARAPDHPIRVWCAGCASGEETYTLAMLLAEALGEDAYTRRVKIYATDVDDAALDSGRTGLYAAKQLESVPKELRDRYFDRIDQRYVFRKSLRRTVIFGRNDLVQDAPISRIDLLVCRNTLMYFNAETQAHILRRFNFALNPDGFLFLGKSEMLITHSELFTPVNLKRRVFAKVSRPTLRDRLVSAAGGNGAHDGEASLRSSAFDAAQVAQVLIDREGTLIEVNHAARTLLALSDGDGGRPLKDLELSYRPVELRGHLDDVFADARAVVLAPATFAAGPDDERLLEVSITPLSEAGELVGACVAFLDVTAERRMQDELEASRRELGNAYEELQSTVEELETTNEELQSTNEELETTNEELQSTNEELETMNEELQSSNEELETMNDELQQRTIELDEINAFMETILTSLGIGVIVLDQRQNIEVWNGHAEDLWGVRAREAEGDHIMSLDIGLPVDRLRKPLKAVMNGSTREDLELEATDRRGKAFRCRVTVVPLALTGKDSKGAVILAERLPA